MLSLTSLLNPTPSALSAPSTSFYPASPRSMSPATPVSQDRLSTPPLGERHKLCKDSSTFPKSKTKGAINFSPFENLDEQSLRLIRKFQVAPIGHIRDNSRHIPYISGKKDFSVKTGRESFEVFQYTFKPPNDDSDYTVMWDYNVGLVRMTPFFKCCKYSKTTPAKMLNLNPGLRDITHSITGGSIMAQGYWMPFSCAKAVCATFCYHIAGCLIPIFGPGFPSECVHPDDPEYGRMIIDPTLVAEATLEADKFRRMQSASTVASHSSNPRVHRRSLRLSSSSNGPSQYGYRSRFRKGLVINSPYGTDTENDHIPLSDAMRMGYIPDTYKHDYSAISFSRQMAPSGWSATSHALPTQQSYGGVIEKLHQYAGDPGDAGANPLLSAVPRHPYRMARPLTPHSLPPPTNPSNPALTALVNERRQRLLASPFFGPMLSAEYHDTKTVADYEYDAGESQIGSSPGTSRDYAGDEEDYHSSLQLPPIRTGGVADRNAALLLMNLSMRDAERDAEESYTSQDVRVSGRLLPTPDGAEKHRNKRRRATSM